MVDCELVLAFPKPTAFLPSRPHAAGGSLPPTAGRNLSTREDVFVPSYPCSCLTEIHFDGWSSGELGVLALLIREGRPDLRDDAVAHDTHLTSPHQQTTTRGRWPLEQAPLAHDPILTRDDLIDRPDSVRNWYKFSPKACVRSDYLFLEPVESDRFP